MMGCSLLNQDKEPTINKIPMADYNKNHSMMLFQSPDAIVPIVEEPEPSYNDDDDNNNIEFNVSKPNIPKKFNESYIQCNVKRLKMNLRLWANITV